MCLKCVKNMQPRPRFFILASKSPRRKEILEKAGYIFNIIPSDFEMDINNKDYNDELLLKCVCGKAQNVFSKIQDKKENFVIISADTVVVLDNKIIGKPKDREDAIKILNSLSGKTHFVATGICIINRECVDKCEIYDGIEKTNVTFKKLNEVDIVSYIDKSKPFDKAGAYGIQDEDFNFVEKIGGNLDNVIGFPMSLFHNLLGKISN